MFVSAHRETERRTQSSLLAHWTYVKHVCHYYPRCSSQLLTFTWREEGEGGVRLSCLSQKNSNVSISYFAQMLQHKRESRCSSSSQRWWMGCAQARSPTTNIFFVELLCAWGGGIVTLRQERDKTQTADTKLEVLKYCFTLPHSVELKPQVPYELRPRLKKPLKLLTWFHFNNSLSPNEVKLSNVG